MAGVSQSVSSFLFCKEDGEAVKFFLRPSETKARLKPLIEERGGIVSSKLSGSQDWIKLAIEGEKISSDDYFTTNYIDDCITANLLLPMDKFRFKQQPPATPSTATFNVVISNASITGRSKYDNTEDTAIIAYIAKHPHSSYSGNRIWKKMELLKVTDHSWQSMKHRFLKKLVDDLPGYIKSQEEKSEKTASSSSSQSVESGDEDETPQKTPDREGNQPVETATDGYHGDAESSPGEDQNLVAELYESSSENDSEFDNYLIRAAEQNTTVKTRGDSQDTQSTDEERPHGSRKRHISLRKLTNGARKHSRSVGVGNVDSAEGTSNEEHSSPEQKRQRVARVSISDEQVADSVTDSDSQVSMLPEAEQHLKQGVNNVVTFVKSAMKEFSVSALTVMQVMYINSGDSDATTYNLQTGRRREGQPRWTKEDDEKLNSTSPGDINDLCGRYGQEWVMKRQAFFN